MSTKIIAHRGGRKLFPENTYLSFTDAVIKGVEGIELDVHFSKDGLLPIHHDYYLGKTNNGKGIIFEKSSEYLYSLDCGSWFSKEFKGEKMPFLPAVLDKFSGKISFEIELKSASEEFVKAILAEVKKRDLFEFVEFTSPHLFVLKRVKELVAHAKTGMFVSVPESWMDEKLFDSLTISTGKFGGISVLHLPPDLINEKRVRLLQGNGFLVHASNCNTISEFKQAFSTRVDQLSTDDVDMALKQKKQYEGTTTTN